MAAACPFSSIRDELHQAIGLDASEATLEQGLRMPAVSPLRSGGPRGEAAGKGGGHSTNCRFGQAFEHPL